MPKPPADIFEDLDISGFEPKAGPPVTPPPGIRAAAESQNFQSREPVRSTSTRTPARKGNYRTGRNTPFSAKVSLECNNGFYGIAERMKWTMGETLEKALAALERELQTTRNT
jgi:hypothetical protein